jgi:hypothetical protein
MCTRTKSCILFLEHHYVPIYYLLQLQLFISITCLKLISVYFSYITPSRHFWQKIHMLYYFIVIVKKVQLVGIIINIWLIHRYVPFGKFMWVYIKRTLLWKNTLAKQYCYIGSVGNWMWKDRTNKMAYILWCVCWDLKSLLCHVKKCATFPETAPILCSHDIIIDCPCVLLNL